ncbi:hypothetical protein Q5530_31825 [Saccharothrix sp. BKS2]
MGAVLGDAAGAARTRRTDPRAPAHRRAASTGGPVTSRTATEPSATCAGAPPRGSDGPTPYWTTAARAAAANPPRRSRRAGRSTGSPVRSSSRSGAPNAVSSAAPSTAPTVPNLSGWCSATIGNRANPRPTSAGVARAVVTTPSRSERRKKSTSTVRRRKWCALTPVRNTRPRRNPSATVIQNAEA